MVEKKVFFLFRVFCFLLALFLLLSLFNLMEVFKLDSSSSDGSESSEKNVLSLEREQRLRAVYISDRTCGECYDVRVHSSVLKERLASPDLIEQYLDVTEAQEYINRYRINAVPTVIVFAPVFDERMKMLLRQGGSFEDEGTFVFRKLEAMGVYRDLSSGGIVVS